MGLGGGPRQGQKGSHACGAVMENVIRIGISSCLLGNPVRYNGGHQHDRFITESLGHFFEFVPVCPEVECGLGVPRESIRLVGDPRSPRLVTTRTGVDHTERMLAWAGKRVRELEQEGLQGFIFKSKSPSSGMERVKVYEDGKRVTKSGVGMFARAFMDHFPLLPVEDEGRLHDMPLRENFVERIFVCGRWRDLVAGNRTRGGLVDFHTRHKLLIMSHSEKHYRALGVLVAHAKERSVDALFEEYEKMLMEALRLKATVNKNCNVLLHMLGYFKKTLSGDEKQEVLEVVDQYKSGYVPLIVPVTLISHFVRKYAVDYLALQYYLRPHPIELKLRNHA
jgi:uncharacterized protein YbgA (DUF1722 family)/uncharacterized protein YbbK (DUF523 family)